MSTVKISEKLFQQTVTCLKKANINFWVDYGTLLGLVREGGIITGDGDFDFGVWDHEVTEQDIIKAFDAKDFGVISLTPYGKRAVHILPHNENIAGIIDIIFYHKEDGRAIHRSCAARSTRRTYWLSRIEKFCYPQVYPATLHRSQREKVLRQILTRIVPGSVKRLFRHGVYFLILRNYLNGHQLIYDFPASHFENLQPVFFLDEEVNIPADVKNYLALAYGKDWRIPKKHKVWYEGATYIDGKKNIT